MNTRYGVFFDENSWVELQDTMPNWSADDPNVLDRAVVQAARTSYLGESKGDDRDKKLLKYLYRNRHTSPFEMVEFKFRIRAPLVVWWQLVRHRTANLNMQSGRYTPFQENDFYTPREWRQQSVHNKQGSDGVVGPSEQRGLNKLYAKHLDDSYKNYKLALDMRVSRELARLFLPAFSLYYTGVWKIDAHNLMHFLRLRMANDAQYEIRAYADVIYREFFSKYMPWTAEVFEESLDE